MNVKKSITFFNNNKTKFVQTFQYSDTNFKIQNPLVYFHVNIIFFFSILYYEENIFTTIFKHLFTNEYFSLYFLYGSSILYYFFNISIHKIAFSLETISFHRRFPLASNKIITCDLSNFDFQILKLKFIFREQLNYTKSTNN